MGKANYKELCKRLKIDHATKWYMHKPESVQENETCKILRDFKIQIDPPNPTKRPDLALIENKKKFTV